MHLAFRGTAFSKSSKDIDRILGYLIREKEKKHLPIKHSVLLKRNSHYLNGSEFKEVMETLIQQGDVVMGLHESGKGMTYDLIHKKDIP